MTKVSKEDKFEQQDFDLFEALTALDKKDYDYFDRLTEEQQKKFVPFMMLHWLSAIKGTDNISRYYVMSTNEYANKFIFNENIQKHPKLQWLMLCASSPGIGKQYHQWIPHISLSVSKLKTTAKLKDIKEYYKKIYSKISDNDLDSMANDFVINQKRKMYLAEVLPNLKIEDIETLNSLVTDEDIKQYEKDRGN